MIRKNDKIKISYYKNKESRYPVNIDLFDVFTLDFLKQDIEKLRAYEYHSEKYDTFKQGLPQYTVSSTFKDGQSKTIKNAKINPVICIDIDYQDNKNVFKNVDIEDVKYQLINNTSVMAVYLSCGGRGLCVIHRLSDSVTKETFNKYFKELEYLYSTIGITIDSKCGNVNRLRFVSYDENVLINDIYEPYELRGIVVENTHTATHGESHENFTTIRKYKINKSFVLNKFIVDNTLKIDGFSVMRRVWLAQTIKRFFGQRGIELAIDIYKAYPNSVVKTESINHLIEAYNSSRPACIREIAEDLVKLGILEIINDEDENISKNVFNLNSNEYLSDVIDKIDFKIGYNMLVADTGYGKTEVWKRIAKQIGVDGMPIHNVLVCEPRNSIVTSKYIDPDFETVYGSKQFPLHVRGLIVTNYDKLIRSHITANDDWFTQFEYFVIDESHLLFCEAYRNKTVTKFIDLLKRISNKTKIVFQTATPTDEDGMFLIPENNIFYVNKKQDKKITIKYVDCYGDMMMNAEMITRNALDNKLYDKVFVYNGTGSVTNDEALKEGLIDKYNVFVYHRKSKEKDIMRQFDEQHRMSLHDGFKYTDFDVIVTSTAASVGIDINDECKVLILIIGNITFEEEKQVAGRFRNCRDMEIRCLIPCGLYNDKNWYSMRKTIFNKIDDVMYYNENLKGVVVNKMKIGHVPIGFVVDDTSKRLAYFQVKNENLRSAYDYKIKKYQQYGIEYTERNKNKNLFDLLKNIDGFISGKTVFKIMSKDDNKKYREVIVDNKKIYRLYGDNADGFVLCEKFYNDNDVNETRKYRKNVSEQSMDIRDKLYQIICSGQWKDDMYKYKKEYPIIERWIDNTVKLYKYYKPIFDVCDRDMINDTNLMYIIMHMIDYSQHNDYDWIEWFVIKLARQYECGIDMCGYCYLLWCLFTTNKNIDKMMKVSYYDVFHQVYDIFINMLNDEMFDAVKTQIESNYNNTTITIDDNPFDDIEIFMKQKQSNLIDIDVLCQTLHKSRYYSLYDLNMLVKHIDDVAQREIIKSYDSLYESMIKSNNATNKSVIVTDKMEERLLAKYNLKIGQKFNSIQELVAMCNLSRMTPHRWLKCLYLSYV